MKKSHAVRILSSIALLALISPVSAMTLDEYAHPGTKAPLVDESKAYWSIAAGPAYSYLSTNISGTGIIPEKATFNLYGGEISAAYHFKGSELGISASVLAGNNTVGSFGTDLIKSDVRAYYHFNYAFNDTLSIYAGPAFGLSVLSVEAHPTLTNINASDTAFSPNVGADAGITLNINEQFGIQLGYSFIYTAGTRLDLAYPGVTVSPKLDDIMAHQVSIKAIYRF